MKTSNFTNKIFSQYIKFSPSYILKLFLNFSKFERQYSYKLPSRHLPAQRFHLQRQWRRSGPFIVNFELKKVYKTC